MFGATQFMPSFCACGCGLQVAESGYHRRDCRRRELAAGRLCPRNVSSAAHARSNRKHNPKNSPINNPIKNPINNPINNLKKKRALRAANLQAVKDDPAILKTQKMSPGTSVSVSVLSDVDWVYLQT